MLADVVVVSWNTRDKLERCLDSLECSAASGVATVTVVDNGSADGSPEAVSSRYPWVRLLRAPTNLGFGPAVNLGAAGGSAPWVVAANADIEIVEWPLERVLGVVDRETAVVAPQIRRTTGVLERSVYRFPSIWATLAGNLGVHRIDHRVERWLTSGAWRPNREGRVDWAVGACLLIRRPAFEAVRGFSSEQWMYAEDLDLCYRLAGCGQATMYTPEIVVLHDHGASTEQAFGAAEGTAAITGAYYDWLAARRGRVVKWTVGIITLAGAVGRLIPAVVSALRTRSLGTVRTNTLAEWIRVNWQGLSSGRAKAGGPG